MKKAWIAVLLLTFLAFVLRVYRLDFVSLRGDEAFTVIFVQRTWDGLWKGIRTIEPNPPLVYLALRVWIALAGASEFATRYFSAFFGVLCVPLLYRLAREMFMSPPPSSPAKREKEKVALFAAALIAINPYQVWHSQDVRNYTLWPALSLVALIFFWRWWRLESVCQSERSGEARSPFARPVASLRVALSLYVLATLASLYTHYYDTFILAALNIFVLALALPARRWKTLARWIGAQAVLVAAYAPWVIWGTNRVTTYGEGSAQQGVPLLDQFSRTLASFVLSDTVPDALRSGLWLPLALALLAVLMYLARRDRSRAAFLFLYIAAPTLALYVISMGRPLFLERYLNGIAPAYYLAFAVGLAAITPDPFPIAPAPFRRWLSAFCILFFVGVSVYALANYYFDPAYAKAPNWRALAQFIAERQQPGDIVVQNFTEMSPIYYQRGTLPVITLPKDYLATPTDTKTLQQLNQDYSRIWFIPAAQDYWDPDHFVETYLTRFDDRAIDARVAEFTVQLYLTPREFSSKIIPINVRIGNALLVGYRVREFQSSPPRIPKGVSFTVVLFWRAAQPIEKDYHVFVHLIDASGRVVAQHDGVPADAAYPTSQWRAGDLIVDAHELKADAAPGTYSLGVGLYDPATLARVPVAHRPDDQVGLTQVAITP
jgi:mannosyltransferase